MISFLQSSDMMDTTSTGSSLGWSDWAGGAVIGERERDNLVIQLAQFFYSLYHPYVAQPYIAQFDFTKLKLLRSSIYTDHLLQRALSFFALIFSLPQSCCSVDTTTVS